MIFLIYVALFNTELNNIKVNRTMTFIDLPTCVNYVEKNEDLILDSLEQYYDKRFIVEMGCVEVKSKSLTPIHEFDVKT